MEDGQKEKVACDEGVDASVQLRARESQLSSFRRSR